MSGWPSKRILNEFANAAGHEVNTNEVWQQSMEKKGETGKRERDGMQIGKLSEPALKRSVLRKLHKNVREDASGDGREMPEYGADCAVLPQKLKCGASGADSSRKPGVECLFSTVNTVPGFEQDPGKLAVAAVNNLAAAGAWPCAFLVSAVLPEDYEESDLQADMEKIAQAVNAAGGSGAAENGFQARVIGGHTQISDAVRRPVYTVTGIGQAHEGACRQQVVLQPGWDLVVTGWIALGGTAALVIRYEEELRKRYPFSLVDRAKEFERRMAVGETARAITHFGTAAVHDLSQGGIFNALWEMADRAGVGLEVDLKKIPIRQETVEICEYFDVNPYYLYSAGALLAGTEHGEALVSALAAQGITAAVIGRATDGKDRVIRNGEECRYLDRPKPDEWYRMLQVRQDIRNK